MAFLYGLVNPTTSYGFTGGRRRFFFLKTDMHFSQKVCVSKYLSIFGVFTYFGKHQIDAERNPEIDKIVTKTHLFQKAHA